MSELIKEQPILFSGEMVRALLDGRKTQTRRVVTPQPEYRLAAATINVYGLWFDSWNLLTLAGRNLGCPFGRPGERLWVREEHYRYGHWELVLGRQTKKGRDKWRFVADTSQVLYGEDLARLLEVYGLKGVRKGMHHKDPSTPAWHKRSGRFMFRAHSRLMLEITDVRVQRLEDISADDCLSEGVASTAFWTPKELDGRPFEEKWWDDFHFQQNYPQIVFRRLWDKLHGTGAWNVNSWVWAISFRHVPQGEECAA